MDNFIYHYTTKDALALILSNETIRFNSLKKVDDGEEAKRNEVGNLQDYIFVSCWSNKKDENISLWNMYSNNMSGIRIGVKKDFLVPQTKIIHNRHIGVDIQEVTNITSVNINCYKFNFYNEVIYDDIEMQRIIKKIEKNEEMSIVEHDKLAIYKKKCWDFQNEVRFILHATAPNLSKYSNKMHHTFSKLNKNNKPNVDYIDMKINLEELNNMEILIGPRAHNGCKIIIEALLERYLPNFEGEIKESDLNIR